MKAPLCVTSYRAHSFSLRRFVSSRQRRNCHCVRLRRSDFFRRAGAPPEGPAKWFYIEGITAPANNSPRSSDGAGRF